MEQATFLTGSYIAAKSFEIQGDKQHMQKYLNAGYNVKISRNGYWLLTKPSKVNVCVKTLQGQIDIVNMKQDILYYYGKKKMTIKLFDKFCKDALAEKIKFYLIENGNYIIK